MISTGDHRGALERITEVVSSYERLVVAFSGGVDSGLLAWAAHRTLGAKRCVAVTAVSPSLSPSERDDCARLAKQWDLRWLEVETQEVSRPEYVANAPDRCYHCKSELMDRLQLIAKAEGASVALGVNLDDLGDHRPGQEAAAERGAVFPLVEAGLTKEGVRAAARAAGLDIWEKPAAACLASRIPYGTNVTIRTLGQVARAEEALKALGYREIRVRHYGDLARLEFARKDLDRAVADRNQVIAAVRAAGYRYVTVDLEGLRSGNLNAAIFESS